MSEQTQPNHQPAANQIAVEQNDVIENALLITADDYPDACQVGRWMSMEKVTKISVEYSGGGDEGDFYHGVLEEGHQATLAPQLADLSSKVASEIVDIHHAGWHNCGGGNGTVNLELIEDTPTLIKLLIHVSHNDTYEEGSDPETNVFFTEGTSEGVAKPLPEDLEQLRALMVENNIPILVLEYSGSGDEGDIQTVYANDGDPVGQNVINHAEEIGHDAIDHFHSGWENNEGGSGNVTITLNHEEHGGFTVEVNHSDTCVESDFHEYAVLMEIPIDEPGPALAA